jgi:replication-associated recombination protein RarA
MNGPDPLSAARQQLCDAISNFQTPTCDPLKVSPWIAMSLLQKAIRRGHEQLALRAAATLLRISPERLWRRCGCIAFEDIGVAYLDTVAVVTSALSGKRYREDLGGEWHAASCIVSRMVQAPKCRAADDLLLAADNHPDFEDTRLAFAFRSTDLPPSDGARSKLGIADLKEGYDATQEAFG